MNMKRFLAYGISAVMLFSGIVANAELSAPYDESMGTYILSTLPTRDDIAARTPQVDITATKIDVTESGFNTLIQTQINNNGQEVYKLTYTVSNLGDLFYGYDANVTEQMCALNGITVKIGDSFGSNVVRQAAGTAVENMTYGFSVDSNTLQLVANLYCADAENPYPSFGELGAFVENASVSFDGIIVVAGGTVVEVAGSDIDVAITYAVGAKGMASQWNPSSATASDFVLGEVEPDPVEDVVVNSGTKYTNGYVWDVTVNKDMEAFGVKFYSGDESIEKALKNVSDLPKLDGGVGYNFNVGLKTAKTIDQADFTADGATGTWMAE